MQTVRNGHTGNGRPTALSVQKKAQAAQEVASDGTVADTKDTAPMPTLPLAPLNQQDTLVWWGTRMPARASFAPEVRALTERLTSHVPYPLRAERLKLRAITAIQAAEAFEEAARQVESDTTARRARAEEPVKVLEARLQEVKEEQIATQYELREAEKSFVECAGLAGILLTDPLNVSPPQVEEALARRLPCGAEVAGGAGTAAAEEHDAARERASRLTHLLTSLATGIMVSLSLGTISGILKFSEFRTPTPVLAVKAFFVLLVGFATEYMAAKFGRSVAFLVFLQRDGQTAAARFGLPGGGRLTWPLAGALVLCYGMMSVLEGIAIRDLHLQVAKLGGTNDALPLLVYCLVGGTVSGFYLWGHTAGAYAEWQNAAHLAFQAHVRREAREKWLEQESGQKVIHLAHLVPALKAKCERLQQEWTALWEERERLSEPGPTAASLSLLKDDDENARGERAEFKHDLDELVEALEPLERK